MCVHTHISEGHVYTCPRAEDMAWFLACKYLLATRWRMYSKLEYDLCQYKSFTNPPAAQEIIDKMENRVRAYFDGCSELKACVIELKKRVDHYVDDV